MTQSYDRNQSSNQIYTIIDENNLKRKSDGNSTRKNRIITISSSDECQLIDSEELNENINERDAIINRNNKFINRECAGDNEINVMSTATQNSKEVDKIDFDGISYLPPTYLNSSEIDLNEYNDFTDLDEMFYSNLRESPYQSDLTDNQTEIEPDLVHVNNETDSNSDFYNINNNRERYNYSSDVMDNFTDSSFMSDSYWDSDSSNEPYPDSDDYYGSSDDEFAFDSEELDFRINHGFNENNTVPFERNADQSSDSEVLIIQDQLPSRRPRSLDPDIVVLESVNLTHMFPRINTTLIFSVIRKLFFAYRHKIYQGNPLIIDQFSMFQIPLSATLQSFSVGELNYLRDKVRSAMSSLISDSSIINFLIGLVAHDKIDNLASIDFPSKNSFKSAKFKDLINVQASSCTICFDNFKSSQMCTTLKCLHTFHSKCIKKWVDRSWFCPICRCKDIS